MPSGAYLMEDFHDAGGLPVVLRELGRAGCSTADALTANGRPIWENIKKPRAAGGRSDPPFGGP